MLELLSQSSLPSPPRRVSHPFVPALSEGPWQRAAQTTQQVRD
jgi:hypothetical protein